MDSAQISLLEGLNAEQREAVSAPPGPTLVVAGPGSGKTTVLTRRVAYLIQVLGVQPRQIMAVTFTNKAAREMTERIEKLLGKETAHGLNIGTFHSLCARILRREAAHIGYNADYTIYDTDDQISLIKAALDELNVDPKRNSPHALLNRISGAKNELIPPDEYPAITPAEKITQSVYSLYQHMLRASNALDFDDLLMIPVLMFRADPDTLRRYQSYYRHVLVDEFQDTNTAQYELVRLFAGGTNNLFAVGDPDQSIYRFRGADPRNVGRFREDYKDARLIRLGQNYRSHQLILDAATAVIRHNADHIPITLTGQRADGSKLVYRDLLTEEAEAQYIVEQIANYVADGGQPRDCAVMYRVNAQSRSLEEAFVRAGLPYRLVGGTRFYSRKEVKDVLAYLRLIANSDDSVSLRRIINTPPRGLGEKTLTQLESWAAGRQQSIMTALAALAKGEPSPFGARAERSLTDFAALMDTWRGAKETLAVGELFEDVLARTRYLDYLNDGTQEAQDRIENIRAFQKLAQDFGDKPLAAFIEDVSLVADAADTREETANAPTLLTLHAAKGLEFKVVFLTGLEDGTLPHSRSFEDTDQMAEERRLMYVGITRAKDVLHLTWVLRRTVYGQGDYLPPSRFLSDIPRELTQGSALPSRSGFARERESYQRATTWSPAPPIPRAQPPGKLPPASSQSGKLPPGVTLGIPANGLVKSASSEAARRPEKPTSYHTGQRVTHDKFGDGIVIASAMRSGIEELEIRFSDKKYGFRRISADFVKPIE